jgi:hypothetical protein
LGNPTVGLFDAFRSATTVPAQIMSGDFTQADLRKLKTMLVFQNAMGVTQLFNAMAGALPE